MGLDNSTRSAYCDDDHSKKVYLQLSADILFSDGGYCTSLFLTHRRCSRAAEERAHGVGPRTTRSKNISKVYL